MKLIDSIFLNLDGLGTILAIWAFFAFGVPLILLISGVALRNKNKKKSKNYLIAAVVYVIIGLGICGSMMI
ncbi:hypothetical protein [Seonamhaeicola sp. ML3]|uniref:hypothetical protein n=1 Tax=Seonamhaeicola sp. ML3 TaxID=2937786 RepID=UPI00201058C7|nr:hypothetical protein [Seonamhaeicola sp. ML3]